MAYYLAKNEKPFTKYLHLNTLGKKNQIKNIGNSYVTSQAVAVLTDYIGTVTKESFAKDFTNACNYKVLSNSTLDSTIME